MTKDELDAFYENQTLSQEDWFKYKGEIYFIQGYWDHVTNKICLVVDNITANKDVWSSEVDDTPNAQENNVKEFMKTPLFDGKTFMEIFSEVKWLYSDEDEDDDDNESEITKSPA